MPTRRVGLAVILVVALGATVGLTRATGSPGVVVHEWGTFTTVAGVDGRAIDWLALGGPTDLPCFVKHVRAATLAPSTARPADPTRRTVTFGPVHKGEVVVSSAKPLTYEQARSELWGKVRMETPVIYFYATREHNARVTVHFPRGVITEFYPSPENAIAPFTTMTLRNPAHVHTLNWNVTIAPSIPEVYPDGGESSHYYAARATDATPLRVGGEQEKFIFYRGVADFEAPIKALVTAGDSVLVVNALGYDSIPAVILFENRNGRMGYRAAGSVARFVTLAQPTLDGDVATIRAALHNLLVSAGLYPKEATAMLDTWRDSWFEEGSRVFYLLPPRSVDAVLPLQVVPAPSTVARVFVGRMELIDRRTLSTVSAALQSDDAATLGRYARFLGPITDRIIANGADLTTANRVSAVANAAYRQYSKDTRICE